MAGLDVQAFGNGVTTGDYDNDGWIDLYVTNLGSNQLWRNRGDGTFENTIEAAGADDARFSVPATFFDYDRDGWLDLYVGNYVDFRLANHKECLSSSGRRDYCGPMAFDPVPDRLFRNRGDGSFEDVTLRAGLREAYGNGLGVIAADFNGDDWPDIYVANDGVENQLWINDRAGRFRNEALMAGAAVNDQGQPEASMGVDVADFDGDGDQDLFMTHLNEETNTLYLNDGSGMFEDATINSGLGGPSWSYTGFGTAWLDYDRDGWQDLYVANGAVKIIEALAQAGDPLPLHQPNQLYRNLGGGRFEEVTARAGGHFEISESSRGVASGDVDNDGDIDLLVTQTAGPARLLLNRYDERTDTVLPGWFGVRLTTGDPARDAIGAHVALHPAGESSLWRVVRTASSYASSRDPRLVFPRRGEDGNIEVRWPSGGVEIFPLPPAGRYTTLHEGQGEPAP